MGSNFWSLRARHVPMVSVTNPSIFNSGTVKASTLPRIRSTFRRRSWTPVPMGGWISEVTTNRFFFKFSSKLMTITSNCKMRDGLIQLIQSFFQSQKFGHFILQLFQRKGFGETGICPVFFHLCKGVAIQVGGKEEDLDIVRIRTRLQFLTDFIPIDVRHHDIQDQ